MNPARLYSDHLYLIRACLRRVEVPSRHRDDMIQEGRIALWKAAEAYDGRPDVKFKSFAFRWIMGAMQHYRRDKTNEIRIPNSVKKYFAFVGTDALIEHEPTVCDDIDGRLIVRDMMRGLSAREQDICQRRFLQGESASEVAMSYGLSKHYMNNLTYRLRRKLREKGDKL